MRGELAFIVSPPIQRNGLNGLQPSGRRENWEPKKSSWICSAHFVSGKKSKDALSPDYVPSVFSFVPSPVKRKQKISSSLTRGAASVGVGAGCSLCPVSLLLELIPCHQQREALVPLQATIVYLMWRMAQTLFLLMILPLQSWTEQAKSLMS